MMLFVLILGKGVRKGEELKAPRYANTAIRDYITTCDIIPNINFYHKFIYGYFTVTIPITKLLKKDIKWL